jgi:hypothetical protein
LLRVGNCALSDALAFDENQGLHQQIAGMGFTLHVINRVVVLYVCVEAKDGHSSIAKPIRRSGRKS